MASQNLRWRDALALKIRTGYRAPVISNYGIAVALMELVEEGEVDGRPVSLPKRGIDHRMFYEARVALYSKGITSSDRGGIPTTYSRLADRSEADPKETLCAIDPFGYVAYLTAMSVYGLTNRLPKILYWVTPDAPLWRQLAHERMSRDLGPNLQKFKELGLPELRRANVEKLDGLVVQSLRTKELGGWRHLKDESIRVATLGNTFLQMLQKPDLCGGIHHVLEVFQQHAALNLQAILSEYNLHGTKIDKVRAGYVLEELCGIEDPRVAEWVKFASRGGSRKLDAQSEYKPVFSERWCLSLNA